MVENVYNDDGNIDWQQNLSYKWWAILNDWGGIELLPETKFAMLSNVLRDKIIMYPLFMRYYNRGAIEMRWWYGDNNCWASHMQYNNIENSFRAISLVSPDSIKTFPRSLRCFGDGSCSQQKRRLAVLSFFGNSSNYGAN